MKRPRASLRTSEIAGGRMAAALHVAARSATTDYAKARKACQSDPTPDAVHDLRVAIRRILAAIDIGWKRRGSASVRRLRRALAGALRLAGPLRDVQVHLELMRDRLAEFPTCREFYEELERDERTLKTKMLRAIARDLFPRQSDFAVFRGTIPARRAATALANALETTMRDSTTRLEPLAAGTSNEIHPARIASRELRYVLEMCIPLAAHEVGGHVDALRTLQNDFGAFHDLETLLERLRAGHGALPAHRLALSRKLERELRTRRTRCRRAAKDMLALGPAVLEPHSSLPHATIYMLRHATAKPRGSDYPDDRTRPLTRGGKKRLTQIAESVSMLNLSADVVLTSPYARAADSASILLEALPRPVVLRTCPWLAPTVSRAVAVTALSHFIREGKTVIVVGHEPALQDLAVRLTGGRKRCGALKKGGLRKIEFFSPDAARAGTIAWTLTPKQLTL